MLAESAAAADVEKRSRNSTNKGSKKMNEIPLKSPEKVTTLENNLTPTAQRY
jgi:hypothetical protein